MKDCNLKRLGLDFNNNDLKVFGEARIDCSAVSAGSFNDKSGYLEIWTSKVQTITIDGDGTFMNSDRSQSLGKSLVLNKDVVNHVRFSNGTYKIIIPDKYSIYILQNTNTEYKVYTIDLDSFAYSPFVILKQGGRNELKGNISELMNIDNLEILQSSSNNKISGSINVFNKSYKLTYLRFNGSSNVTGDIKDLFDAQASHRNNGETLAVMSNGVLTYNGTIVNNASTKTATFDGNGGYTVT